MVVPSWITNDKHLFAWWDDWPHDWLHVLFIKKKKNLIKQHSVHGVSACAMNTIIQTFYLVLSYKKEKQKFLGQKTTPIVHLEEPAPVQESFHFCNLNNYLFEPLSDSFWEGGDSEHLGLNLTWERHGDSLNALLRQHEKTGGSGPY